MTVLVLPTAQQDLSQIHRYLAAENPLAADAQLDMLLDSIERLGEFPFIGRVSSFDPDIREWVISTYLIRYVVDPEALRVLQVIHGARYFRY